MRSRALAIDSHDAGALRGVARRTRLVRFAAAAAAILFLAAATASARDLDVRERGLLPSGTTGVLVLDLSLSIADRNYVDVRRALRRLVVADAPVGLVVFSDVPYELFPPGTPAGELQPVLRLLTPSGPGPVVHPWLSTFRAGTRISAALELAREMLRRDRAPEPAILLVSDLETAPEDLAPLARTLAALRRDSIAVRIVPLAPSSEARLLFEGLVGKAAFSVRPEEAADGRDRVGDVRWDAPVGLLAFGGLFFLAVAAHERFGARLALPRAARHGSRPR